MLAVALAYYVFGRLSLAIPPLALHVSLVWLPAGVAVAGLLRWGLGMWPGVAVAGYLLAASAGVPAGVAAALAAGKTAGPLVAAWSLNRLGLHHALDRRQDLWRYVVLGAAAGPLLSASNGVFWLNLAGLVSAVDVPTAWLHWWLGDAVGAMLLGIPLLTASRATLHRAFGEWRWIPTTLLSTSTVAAGLLAFSPNASADGLSPLMFVPHLLMCWLAVRSGIFAASLPILVLTGAAAYATASGLGPFYQGQVAHSLALLWGYAGTLLATPLLLTALVGELRANDERWQLALASSNIGVAEWNLATDEFTLSQRWLKMLGHTTQSFGATFDAAWAHTHEEDQASLRDALASLRETDCESARAEFRMQRKDGAWKWLEGHAVVAERASNGEPRRIILTARDIAEQRVAEERYQLSAKLFQHLHEGLLITDANHRVLDANPTYSAITGYAREEMLGTLPSMMRPAPTGSAAERQQNAVRESLRLSGSWRGEIVDRRRNGDACSLQVTISAVQSGSGQIRFYAWALSDITQAQAQRAQLERQAHTDELTGLPNRARLAQLLRDAMRASEREGFLLTICYLDLDHFKPVNDRFGHEAGDRLLVDLAERLRRSLRHWASGDDAVARLGGDEFVLLLRTATLEEGRHAVERLMRNVSMPYGLGVGAGPVSVTASIGATVYPIDKADADTLLRHADHAMYGAKQAGRNGYLFFDAEHDRRTEQHFEAVGRVQDALDAGQFALYYQPKVDMRQGKVLGVEALLRWKHPQHGVIAPAQFLPLIEHTALSARLGDWVLQQGIEQLAAWQRQGLDMTVSVNISARHLQEPLFAKRLAGLLARHSTPVGHRLVIEVLETAALADVEYTCALMQECRALGVRFALDDFGTGYSTFTYLKRLPLDLLKIDRSFVHNMLTDRQDLAIVEGVIGLSETFSCTVVAEGVESAEQALRLIELGCDVGQGNGIAEAMPVADVYAWVRNYRNPFIEPRPAETV
ncbi:EAL domain-containing protein [Piscinibacter sp. XHJ-5]|uniref:bifunctional diguanylate cyclase/phosphodiesterase n=1 Tax=Piscinibacter sp. XHJ-5 TaxID=3037797 RepID=UPI002452B4B6|nr:EAL domain-containing protein [Piscinibacter sp. XHJ-5]